LYECLAGQGDCRVSFNVHTTHMVTCALPLQGCGSGTLCRL